MIITGTAVAFLLLVIIVLPYLSIQSARHLGSGVLWIPRGRLYAQVIGTQAFLFFIGWFTARENGIDLWKRPRTPLISWASAAVLLVVMLAMLRLRWPGRSPSAKARLNSMLPQNARERWPYVGVCIAAGIAEEIVYRGVLTTLLASYLQNVYIAALISAIAFGFAHMIQGWRSVISTTAIGILMQALVAVASSLVPAMVVHATYDFVAGMLVPKWYAATLPLPDAAPAVGQ